MIVNQTQIEVYQSFIDENLERLARLETEVKHWQSIYEKRVFEGDWPETIKKMLNILKFEIKETIQETNYYIQQTKEMGVEYAKTYQAQFEKNKGTFGIEGGGSQNPDNIPAGIE